VQDLKIGEHDLLSTLRPDTLVGALVYFGVFVVAAALLSRALRAAVRTAVIQHGHIDRTTISFLQQLGSALIWVIMLILYAHLIPALRAMGTALLAGVSVASVVIGLAAQSTLGNLVAGVAIALYRPFRLGDTIQVAAPTGTEVGVVSAVSLGYTAVLTGDGRTVVLPNNTAASQVLINLSERLAPRQIYFDLDARQSAELETVRAIALEQAREIVDGRDVTGCALTQTSATSAVLELKMQSADARARELLRATVLSQLSRRLLQAHLGATVRARPGQS